MLFEVEGSLILAKLQALYALDVTDDLILQSHELTTHIGSITCGVGLYEFE